MSAWILGEGPPLIAAPGIASNHRSLAPLFNRMSERYRTIQIDYPGDLGDDGARLGRIDHDGIVDDIFELIEAANLGRAFLFGVSFGSTVVLRASAREPRRFPKIATLGGFARRPFSVAEKLALAVGRRVSGNVARLPFYEKVMTYNHANHFPSIIADRWPIYLELNGSTPISALSHRLELLSRLDLRPDLAKIRSEALAIHGNEDRIVARRHHDELVAGLPAGRGLLVPTAGHQPHFTHVELLAQLLDQFYLPCVPEGCSRHDAASRGDAAAGSQAERSDGTCGLRVEETD
ncbi:MAG: alpha/beta hydrolase [Isosphaeraceae bacterium]|nr:alpha/beta hydrolase [Isosphaeraceae bacterium]